MERERFAELLAREGFQNVVTVSREPNGFLDVHVHPFEAKALILKGELSIWTEGVEQLYRAGQVFHLQAGEPHSERYGAEGVEYLVGRK